jgi:uncharacterized protein YgfB (UPF0149 family)
MDDKRKELLKAVIKTVKRDIEKVEMNLDKDFEDLENSLYSIAEYIERQLLVIYRLEQKSQSILQ